MGASALLLGVTKHHCCCCCWCCAVLLLLLVVVCWCCCDQLACRCCGQGAAGHPGCWDPATGPGPGAWEV